MGENQSAYMEEVKAMYADWFSPIWANLSVSLLTIASKYSCAFWDNILNFSVAAFVASSTSSANLVALKWILSKYLLTFDESIESIGYTAEETAQTTDDAFIKCWFWIPTKEWFNFIP